MQTRFSFGGDEHIFAEVDDSMSLDGFLQEPLRHQRRCATPKSTGVTRSARPTPPTRSSSIRIRSSRRHAGRAEATGFVDREIRADHQDADHRDSRALQRSLDASMTLMRFRERHQNPDGTDLEYAARIKQS